MTVGAESCALLNTVFVDDAKRTESFVFGIIVGCKREGMEAIQPAMVGSATVGPWTLDNFHGRRSSRHTSSEGWSLG